MSARLFLALWPAPAVRAQLAAARDQWTWPNKATPVRTERLHVTLHFIGEVAQERVAEIADALPSPCAPFELRLGRHVLWPHGIAVLEPDSTPPALAELHATLGEQLVALGLPVDARPYRPHVTLARRAGGALVPADRGSIRWLAERYALVQSHAGTYELLREYTC
jgi:2'-5' RNA ligase